MHDLHHSQNRAAELEYRVLASERFQNGEHNVQSLWATVLKKLLHKLWKFCQWPFVTIARGTRALFHKFSSRLG